MSAGRFLKTFYESNAGDVYNIKVQPESVTAFNPVAAGPSNQPVSARARGSSRTLGMNARAVSLEWVGAAPPDYDDRGILRVPILTENAYDQLNVGSVVQYLGEQARVVGLIPERRR